MKLRSNLRNSLVCLTFMIFSTNCMAQSVTPKNLILVTIDGVRWQEIFNGADSMLLFNSKYISQDSAATIKQYWSPNSLNSREMLTPFLWRTIGKKGQLYGNRNYSNNMQVKNKYWFSYPGYAEILSGFTDDSINSNAHPANENDHILAFLNRQPGYKNKVAAFANWSAFGRIINGPKYGFLVSYGNFPLPDSLVLKNKTFKTLNDMQPLMPALWETDRLDGLTYAVAKTYLEVYKPKVVYLALGEPDEWAHSGKYDYYLDATKKADAILSDLWVTLQSDSFYRDNTYLLITTDHGRGNGTGWTSHNTKTPGSNETWMAILGPGIRPSGEIKFASNYYQSQLAQTIAYLLGFTYKTLHIVDEKINLYGKD